MNIETLRDQGLLIFEAIVGSRLYGTNTEESDTDIFGVYILPNSYILGGTGPEVIHVKDDVGKLDCYYFEFRKYLRLLSSGSPQAIESLFIPKEFILHKNEIFDELVKERDNFITQNCKFSFGYSAIHIIQESEFLKSLNLVKDYLDFFKTLPDNRLPNSLPFREYNMIANATGDKIEPENVRLVAVPGMDNIYSVYYSYRLHYNIINKVPSNVKVTGMSPNDQGNLTTCSLDDIAANKTDYPFTMRLNVFFDKKGYLDYQKLIERRSKAIEEGIKNKKLAHAYRLMNFGINLASRKEINFDSILMRDILENKVKPDNLAVIFNNCKERLDQAYSNITHTIDKEWLKSLEVTLRSRAELLRTLNKEHFVDS